MAEIVEVWDVADPRLDDFRDLAAADRRPDRPGGRGLVIGEGVIVVQRLLASVYRPRALFGVRHRLDALGGSLAGIDVPVYVTSAELMADVVGFHLNRGVLASADRVPLPGAAALAASARLLAVLEGVNDHENLGALFRNAAAFGVDGVLLGERCADPLYRRSVRVSMGHVLRMPFAPLRPWPGELAVLRVAGFRLVGLTPDHSAVPLRSAGLERGRVALLLGAEGPGLSSAALAAVDEVVRIPMADGVDSLNVATAAAVAFAAAAAVDPSF